MIIRMILDEKKNYGIHLLLFLVQMGIAYTFLEIVSGIKKAYIPSEIKHGYCSNNFVKLSLRFWSLYRYLNYPHFGRYMGLLYKYR